MGVDDIETGTLAFICKDSVDHLLRLGCLAQESFRYKVEERIVNMPVFTIQATKNLGEYILRQAKRAKYSKSDNEY